MKDLWTNSEHDLYWVRDMTKEFIDRVESLIIDWAGDPGKEVGTFANARFVVQMPTPITAFENGDGLLVVHSCCGARGTGVYSQSDIRLRLERCAVDAKSLESPFTTDPSREAVVCVLLQLRGTLRTW